MTEEEEGAVSMSGLSCDRNYIVCICLGRQTTSITPLTSIFTTQSRIDRSRELLMTSYCTGTASSRLPRRGRTRRPQGRFMTLSKKASTDLEGRQHQRRQREDRLFDTGETLEFPVGMFLQAWQPRTGLAASQHNNLWRVGCVRPVRGIACNTTKVTCSCCSWSSAGGFVR